LAEQPALTFQLLLLLLLLLFCMESFKMLDLWHL
jgi:hypothetical protein